MSSSDHETSLQFHPSNPYPSRQSRCIADLACTFPAVCGPYCRMHAADYSASSSLYGSAARRCVELGGGPLHRNRGSAR